MKNGIFNLNETDLSKITLAKNSLNELKSLTNVHIDNNDYTNVPLGADLDPRIVVR